MDWTVTELDNELIEEAFENGRSRVDKNIYLRLFM